MAGFFFVILYMFKKIVFVALSILMGALFIFSGYSKLRPVEPFEFTFVDIGISNWRLSPFFARTIIGLEFFIGVLYIFNIAVKGFTSKVSIGLLSFFTIYLTVLLIKNGNEGNCGCFGEMVPMTPLESIIKNVFLLGISFLLFKMGVEINLKRFRLAVLLLFFLAGFGMPYILNPVDLNYSEAYLIPKEDHYAIPLDTLINNGYVNPVPQEIKKGKHIIAFLSSTCPHCKIGATKLRIMKEKNKDLPVFFVINGEEENVKTFLKLTGSESIPWTKLGERPFVYLAGLQLPTILLVNDQVVENDLNYFTLDQTEIENWLKK